METESLIALRAKWINEKAELDVLQDEERGQLTKQQRYGEIKAYSKCINSLGALIDEEGAEQCESCNKRLPMGEMKADNEGVPLCPTCLEEEIKEIEIPTNSAA